MKRPDLRKNLRRGIYVIPTSLTILNLFFGFRCIVNSLLASQAIANGHPDVAMRLFERACLALFIAAVFDTFDGLVARQLGATSEFGKEYDSLADVVTFGAAPAVLLYAWGLHVLGRSNLGVGISFLFLVAVSLRLARFNVMTGKTDYRYFVGLPSPAGALTLASVVQYAPAPVTEERFAIVILILTIAVSFAMVSPVRWRSQKGMNLQKERSLMYFLGLALIIALFLWSPKEFCLVFAIGYLISGPVIRLWSILFPPRKPMIEESAPLEAH
jgi:CDP-diacylglycerol--serine O-phosphatidyltransferase